MAGTGALHRQRAPPVSRGSVAPPVATASRMRVPGSAAAGQQQANPPAPRRTSTPGSSPSTSSSIPTRTHLQAVAQRSPSPPAPSLPSLPAPPPAGLLLRAQWYFSRVMSSPHDGVIFNLAAPAILALAADPLLAMVDTAIVGHLGQSELAAMGVNTSLFGFAFVVFNFLSTATTPMVAAALSGGDKAKAGETILQALGLALALGAIVTGVLGADADSALALMGLDPASDPETARLAREFLVVRATAAPAALLVTVSQGVFRGLQDMRTPLAVTLGTNLLHLGLSLAFIFPGHMGLTGAAASTSVAEWLAAGAYLALGWGRRKELGLDPLPKMDVATAWRQYLPFLQAGGAVLMRTAVLLGTKTLASAVATRLGPASIASHQVLTQVWSMSSLLIDSLGISGQTLVAVSLGQGDRATARAVTDRLLQLGLGLGLCMTAGLTLLGPAWPHLFTQDTEVLSAVEQLLPLAVWMLPLNALVYVLDGVLVGASDFQFLVGAMVLASGSAATLLLAVEPLHLGLAGVWGAQVILMAGRAATLASRYWSQDGPLPPMESSSSIGGSGSSTSSSTSSGSTGRSSRALLGEGRENEHEERGMRASESLSSSSWSSSGGSSGSGGGRNGHGGSGSSSSSSSSGRRNEHMHAHVSRWSGLEAPEELGYVEADVDVDVVVVGGDGGYDVTDGGYSDVAEVGYGDHGGGMGGFADAPGCALVPCDALELRGAVRLVGPPAGALALVPTAAGSGDRKRGTAGAEEVRR